MQFVSSSICMGPLAASISCSLQSCGPQEAWQEGFEFEGLVRLAKSPASQPWLKDVRIAKSNPWNPANLLMTTDYDCTCTVEDSCELLVWAKEDCMNITDRRLMKDYEALWEDYERALREHIAARPEFDTEATTSSDDYGGECLMDCLHSLGLDPRLESAQRGSRTQNELLFSLPHTSCVRRPYFDSAGLRKSLKHLGALELDINGKIVATGFLSGLRRDVIWSAGKRVTMQPHCRTVLSRLTSLGTAIHVISANWSRDLIYGGLASLHEDCLFVHCNNLEFDAAGVTTGHLDNRVTNALDKEKVQQALRKMTLGHDRMVVYLGDAQTDILALLDADLGIVMGKRAALRNLLDQYDIKLYPLEDAAALLATGLLSTFRQSGFLFQASGWEDVEACLFSEVGEHQVM